MTATMPQRTRAPAVFVTSAAAAAGFPPPAMPEVAFIGRSNVGKSSLLNRLAGARRLAQVSKTPGRTRTVNFFDVGGNHRLVDLPGYGFARIPDAVRAGWEDLVLAYLTDRESLVLHLLLVDSRRDPLASDREAFALLRGTGRAVAVVATKVDRMRRGETRLRLRLLEEAYGEGGAIPVIACSTVTLLPRAGVPSGALSGISEVRRLIAEKVEAWR